MNFGNMGKMMEKSQLISAFLNNHPKLYPLIAGIKEKGFCSGQEIAIAVRYPDGAEHKTGIRLSEEDLEILRKLKEQ